MKKALLTLLTVLTVFLAGCSTFKNKEVIIKVNDAKITKQMFDDSYNQSEKGVLQKGDSDKNKFLKLVMKDRVVNELIIKEMLEQEYKKLNITISDEELEKPMKKIYDVVGGQKAFQEGLKLSGKTEEQYREAVVNELKADKLLEKINNTKITDKDALNYYKENKATKFIYPDMVRASHILIMANESDVKNAIKKKNPKITEEELNLQTKAEMKNLKTKSENLLAEVKKDPSKFTDIARKESEDLGTANLGGDLGFFSKQDVPEEFAKATFSEKPGHIIGVIQTVAGYHIIKVTDRKAAGITPYEEVKNDIKAYLENERRISSLQKYVDGLKSKTKIEYVDKSYDPAEIQKEIKDVMQKINKSTQPTVKTEEKKTK